MKSTRIVFVVLFVTGCLMNGCTENPPPILTPGPELQQIPTGAGLLTATIDGLAWAALDNAGISTGTSTFNGTILHIKGVRAIVVDTARENLGAETIDLVIDLTASKVFLGLGTYELGTIPADQGTAQYHDAQACVCNTNSTHAGTVTITGLDVTKRYVSGTFAFNGVGLSGHGHTVSEGNFDVAWK